MEYYSVIKKKEILSFVETLKAVKNETELEFSLTYYKEEIQGKVIHEIDVYNKKAVVNGKDLYEKVRSILS